MSLINDALKRAKQSQKEQPPVSADAPPLRPVDPSPRPGLWPLLFLPLLLAVVLALAGIFFWRWLDQTKRQPLQTTTKSSVEANSPAPNKTAIPSATSPIAQTTPVSLPPASVPSAPTGTLLPVATNLSSLPAANSASNPSVAAASEPLPAKPTPPSLKLHGIFYTRTNPSAVINGKIRAVGDRIGEAQVVAIGTESVKVVVGGKTNELILP